MTDYKKLGRKGERAVAKYLRKNKFKIITKNYSSKFGEIDIIAENRDYIAFVEVKTRTSGQMLDPMYSVGYKKQERIIKTAAVFCKRYITDKQSRFDIAEVIVNEKGKLDINYIDNAFIQRENYASF